MVSVSLMSRLIDGVGDAKERCQISVAWGFEKGVKEAIYMWALKPSLNRNGGRYNLINERLMENGAVHH